ncbi:MAG: 8-amino-7-oxononanoate synthase, partial [Verrucomicrobiota bacterium]
MKNETWIESQLADARRDGLERTIRPLPRNGGKFELDGRETLNFSSNDYLDLARQPEVIEVARRALDEQGVGATASRLVTGALPLHQQLEDRLARLKGYPDALLFGSGFLTNVGTIPAVVGRNDHIFADRLIHASMIDAATLSRARIHRFRHNDMDHLENLLRKSPEGRRLILAESVYSMDGDLAPVAAMTELSERYGAMIMIDEAHAMGIFGRQGCGRVREHGLEDRVNLSMGTLSKALGGYGGFVACSESFRAFLVNRARSFIYTTALPPASVGAALGAL